MSNIDDRIPRLMDVSRDIAGAHFRHTADARRYMARAYAKW